jgi:hypothetical protein
LEIQAAIEEKHGAKTELEETISSR